MAEQQLVDYIKKAKEAGQADDQTRSLLLKNGWTEAEVSDAFAFLIQPQAQPRPKPQAQPEPRMQPRATVAPEIEDKPRVTVQQPQAQPKVQPQQPQPAQPVQDNMPKIKRKSHLFLKLLMVLIIVVVLCGAGLFVAGQYINLPWNPFWPNPATVISNMLSNMKNVKSSHATIAGEIAAATGSVSQGKLAFNIDSKSDITNISSPKADVAFKANLTVPGFPAPYASIDANAIVAGGAFYIKLNDFIAPNQSPFPGLDFSQIKGKWFKVDQNSINALSQAGAGQVQTINLSGPEAAGATDILQGNNPELVKKIQDLVAGENIITVTKQFGDAVVSGQNTYHYLVTISKDKLKDLANKIIALEMPGTTDSAALTTQNTVKTFENSIIDAIGDINMEMWIGKKDSMLYEAKLDKTIDLSKIIPILNLQLSLKLDTINSNFNKPITVQAPEGAQKLEDFALPLIEASIKTSKINSDMNNIGFIAQSVFAANQSYSSLCSHGLLNGYLATYGTDLVSSNNNIVSQGAKKPACFSAVQDYCASTQLADGNYLCIDKNNQLGTTQCISASTVCN